MISQRRRGRRQQELRAGSGLVEVLVGVVIFLLIALSGYRGYLRLLEVVQLSRLKITAVALLNEQAEIIRNLPYSDVGIVGGLPVGKIPHTQILTRGNTEFTVTTTIRNIDDPFDGTIGGSPNDPSPADYKLAEIELTCLKCNFQPLYFTTTAAPKNLETASTNGALLIRVFDANGQPLPRADVHIKNNQAAPPFTIEDVTDNKGQLLIVDAPPGIETYEITVSKPDYSVDQTYPSGAPANPNPVKPHATVALQQVTQISFVIDRVSSLRLASVQETCLPVGSVDFSLEGSKLIGENPAVLKYSENHLTSGAGLKNIEDLEWDTYHLALTDPAFDLAGAIPPLPLNLIPNTTQEFKLIVAPENRPSLLVTVADAGSQLPVTNATVVLTKGAQQESAVTGRGSLRQTDWSGGPGQINFIDPAKYFSTDGNIADSNPAGELRLKMSLGQYVPSGTLISSTFDTGTTSNFYQILWQPQDQPPETGPQSVRFQLATTNDSATSTWAFLGPDGTPDSFYTLANSNIHPLHDGDRYLRCQVFLETADPAFTPNLAELAFTFSSACTPPGQVFFGGLASGSYALTVSKDGYQIFNDVVDIVSGWQERQVLLAPQ